MKIFFKLLIYVLMLWGDNLWSMGKYGLNDEEIVEYMIILIGYDAISLQNIRNLLDTDLS